tara:strand:+ start:615 stop:887 length:273 start_codon:yes stop_codon:yes gene_type:complete
MKVLQYTHNDAKKETFDDVFLNVRTNCPVVQLLYLKEFSPATRTSTDFGGLKQLTRDKELNKMARRSISDKKDPTAPPFLFCFSILKSIF